MILPLLQEPLPLAIGMITLLKIPVWGDLRNSQRYKDADKVLKENPNVKKLVSHSLGGSVSLELETNNPVKYETTTYGAPVFLGLKGGNRYRHKKTILFLRLILGLNQ